MMLNNMLGEEDLARAGFQRWPRNRRLASMMAPTVVEAADGRVIALGTGGSNRIRSAILHVLLALLDDGVSPRQAVTRPRAHVEDGHLDVEPGFSDAAIERAARVPGIASVNRWAAPNLYFGGVHVVEHDPARGGCHGAGDPRRSGVARQEHDRSVRPAPSRLQDPARDRTE